MGNTIKLLVSLLAALIVYLITPTLTPPQLRMALVLLILAAALWITESIPLAATSLLIALLQPLWGIQSFSKALVPFFDSVVVLLLGGFLLAIAVDKHDLDELMGLAILRRAGKKPRRLALGLMLGTTFLSCWVNNTAAAAVMMTVAMPIIKQVQDPRGNFPKIMVLGVAYSATIGGMMTLVGSPPNAMAWAFLAQPPVSLRLSFALFSVYALPPSLIALFGGWAILCWRFPPGIKEIPPIEHGPRELRGMQKGTLVIFLLAVVLWLTESIHGLNSSMVAIVVAAALFLTGLLKKEDVGKADWNTLLLFGGGLSLGAALQASGLATLITDAVLALTPSISTAGVAALLGASSLIFSAVASTTASASIFLPIAINVAQSLFPGSTQWSVVFAVLIVFGVSIDFMLPIGTPPNAIAYSTGHVSMREMLMVGFVLNLVSFLAALLLALTLWPLVPLF
jgi:sodium-dependent dicarboxylate transporter 2/3/5